MKKIFLFFKNLNESINAIRSTCFQIQMLLSDIRSKITSVEIKEDL